MTTFHSKMLNFYLCISADINNTCIVLYLNIEINKHECYYKVN